MLGFGLDFKIECQHESTRPLKKSIIHMLLRSVKLPALRHTKGFRVSQLEKCLRTTYSMPSPCLSCGTSFNTMG